MRARRKGASAAALFAAAVMLTACGSMNTPSDTPSAAETAAPSASSADAKETSGSEEPTAAPDETTAAAATTAATEAAVSAQTAGSTAAETTAAELPDTAETTAAETADTAEAPVTESADTSYSYEDSYTKKFIGRLSEQDFTADITLTTSQYVQPSRLMVNGSDFYFGKVMKLFDTEGRNIKDPGNEFSTEIYVIDGVRTDVSWENGTGHYHTYEKGDGGSNSVITARGIAATIFYADMFDEGRTQSFRADTDENGAPCEWFGDLCFTYDPGSGDLVRFSGADGMTAEYSFTFPCGEIMFDGSAPQYDTDYEFGPVEMIYPWGPFAEYHVDQ